MTLDIRAGDSIEFSHVGTHEIQTILKGQVWVYQMIIPLSEIEILIQKGIWKLHKRANRMTIEPVLVDFQKIKENAKNDSN